MPNLDLPAFELDGVKFTVINRSQVVPDLLVLHSDVSIHCQGHEDEHVVRLAHGSLRRLIQARIGRLLCDRAVERPAGQNYYFDHRKVLVSGDDRMLERVNRNIALEGELPRAVFMNTPELQNALLEAPALFIDEDNDTRRVVNWYLAHVHLQIGRPELTHELGRHDYVANFAIRYQIELASGDILREEAVFGDHA